jgi:hypothetical protein
MGVLKYLFPGRPGPKAKDLTGLKFGKLTALRPSGKSNHYGIIWIVRCECGKEFEKGASELIRKPRRKNQIPQSCGCYGKRNRSPKYKGIGDLSHTKFHNIQNSAKERNLLFKITIRQAWNLFIKQNGKCALTGISITLNPKSVVEGANTASLDRIDNSKGYVRGNLQWVHVRINFMKHAMSQEEFVQWCRLVTKYNRKKKSI